MDKKTLKGIEVVLRKEDDKRFKQAAKIISELSGGQARFALLLANQRLRGYLAMPEPQKSFIADLDRAKKAR